LGGQRTSASFDPDAYHAFLIAFIMKDAEHSLDLCSSLSSPIWRVGNFTPSVVP
jgi:hypothetical protein